MSQGAIEGRFSLHGKSKGQGFERNLRLGMGNKNGCWFKEQARFVTVHACPDIVSLHYVKAFDPVLNHGEI